MPLRITIELVSPHGTARLLARADVRRVADGTYEIDALEGDNMVANEGMWSGAGVIEGHDRAQSVWSLVDRVAAWSADYARRRKASRSGPPALIGETDPDGGSYKTHP